MAATPITLHADAAGAIVRAVLSDLDAARYPDPPPGTAATLVADPDTNAALVADLYRSTDPYRLAGGALQKNGQPVAINPDDPARVERQAAAADLAAQYQAALTRLDAIIAAGSSLTAAQTRDAVVDVARIVRRALRLLKAQVG